MAYVRPSFVLLSVCIAVLCILSLPASSELVEEPPLILPYHGGPLVAGGSSAKIYVIWYGRFSRVQRRIIQDFLASFGPRSMPSTGQFPTVSSWWNVMTAYKNKQGVPISSGVQVKGQVSDRRCSLGKLLKASDLETLVERSLRKFPADPSAIYLLLTADNVAVEDFCTSTCASHSTVSRTGVSKMQKLIYAWVGNSASQCPGQCAWPFAIPSFMTGSNVSPLGAPNGDVGIDGMIINIATILAGTVSNPYGNGYYQGDDEVPLEAATACAGIFGSGSYPGYPGELLADKTTGAMYNAVGINSRRYLVPALWNPKSRACKPTP